MEKKIIFFIGSCCILIVVLMEIVNFPSFDCCQKIANQSLKSEVKTILLANAFYSNQKWRLTKSNMGSLIWQTDSCPVKNCIVTKSKSFLSKVDEFDAILFHTTHPPTYFKRIPEQRKQNQIYIYVNNESPAYTDRGSRIPQFFNWTLTYRLNSDIINYYGKFIDLEKRELVAPRMSPQWRLRVDDFKLNEETENFIAGKTKMAAWFVSNCQAESKRQKLVKKLQKYLDVDIYGACGQFKCRRFSDKCFTMLNNDYKFYLSFENSLCDQYVTEKLFRPMEYTVVPIVYGGANYSQFAPPHSYINVEDYENVAELAKYLLYLDKHPEEYRKYFWWKNFYKSKASVDDDVPFCDICVSLNNPVMTMKTKYYENMEKWFSKDQCRKPKIKF